MIGYVIANDVPAAVKTLFTSSRSQWGDAVRVCDGVNDEADIGVVCSNVGIGMVRLIGRTFNLDAALSVATGSILVGDGGGERSPATCLNIRGTSYGITLGNTVIDSYCGVMTRIRSLAINTPAAFAGTALKLQFDRGISGNDILSDITIKAHLAGVFEGNPDQTAGSVGLQLISNGHRPFELNHFGPIFVSGFETGMHLKANHDSSSCYINGNVFDFINCKYGKYLLKLESTGTADINASVSGNIFNAVTLQPKLEAGYHGLHAIALETVRQSMGWNHFNSIFIWDWAGSGDDYCIHTAANTVDNHFTGWFNNTGTAYGYKDEGGYNTFTRRT